jgi:hypothetical protein
MFQTDFESNGHNQGSRMANASSKVSMHPLCGDQRPIYDKLNVQPVVVIAQK